MDGLELSAWSVLLVFVASYAVVAVILWVLASTTFLDRRDD